MSGSKKVFTTLGSSNHVPEEREAFDYYATDPRAVEMLLKLEQFSPVIWEPALFVICIAAKAAWIYFRGKPWWRFPSIVKKGP